MIAYVLMGAGIISIAATLFAGCEHKAKIAAEREAAVADGARDLCLKNLDGWQAVAAEQNQAVENLRKESARRLALAAKAASEREAEAEARGRSAGALAALSARPAADGDESCAAADRVIVEGLR